jgi:tRNA(Arg) A34 adenosine deaminase TadA
VKDTRASARTARLAVVPGRSLSRISCQHPRDCAKQLPVLLHAHEAGKEGERIRVDPSETRGCRGDATPAPSHGRRHVLGRLAGLGALLAAWPVAAVSETSGEIAQPARPGREGFMQRAFELRRLAADRGDQAFGTVIVRARRIVGKGVSAVITTPDPTAHAEIQATRDAACRLRTPDVSGCELYGTSRACPMCRDSAYWARVARLWYGTAIVAGGTPELP